MARQRGPSVTDDKSVSAISHSTNQETDEMSSEMTKEQWLAIRKEAALQIDPETAEVFWRYAQILDPYGVKPDLPDECDCVGRVYFARSPGSDIWVCFDDLPEMVCDACGKSIVQSWPFRRGLKPWPGWPASGVTGDKQTSW
jgi:hypothetical protein